MQTFRTRVRSVTLVLHTSGYSATPAFRSRVTKAHYNTTDYNTCLPNTSTANMSSYSDASEMDEELSFAIKLKIYQLFIQNLLVIWNPGSPTQQRKHSSFWFLVSAWPLSSSLSKKNINKLYYMLFFKMKYTLISVRCGTWRHPLDDYIYTQLKRSLARCGL